MTDRFYKKKQLLEQRNLLLEEIGQSVFDKGLLPAEFSELPAEFRANQTLVSQLRDRYRTLREDRDRAHYDYTDLEDLRTTTTQRFARELRDPLRDLNALQLKVQYVRDQVRKSTPAPRKSGASAEASNPRPATELETELAKLTAVVEALETQRDLELEAIHTRMTAQEKRLSKLDLGITKVQDEEERLNSDRRKRVWDIGFHYYDNRLDESRFGEKYDQLDHIVEQLSDHPPRTYQFDVDTPLEHHTRRWLPFVLTLAGAILVIFLFRTRYLREEIPLGGIADRFLRGATEYRLYVNFGNRTLDKFRQSVPDLALLPGGESFAEMGSSDLLAFLQGGDDDLLTTLRFCGLKFRHAPSRVVKRLREKGWQHYPSPMKWEILTDNYWMWAILSNTEFFLFKSDDLEDFRGLRMSDHPALFRIERRIEPFDNNAPLLQGLHFAKLTLETNRFLLELETDQELIDLGMRLRRLEYLKTGLPATVSGSIRFEGRRLLISGIDNELGEISVADAWLKALAEQKVATFLGEVEAQKEREVNALSPPAKPTPNLPRSSDSGLLVYSRSSRGDMRQVQKLNLGKDIRSLSFSGKNNALVVADQGSRSLFMFRLVSGRLVYDRQYSFESSAAHTETEVANKARFRPGAIIKAPGEQFAVVLETKPEGRPRIMLLRIDDLTPTSFEELPEWVEEPLSGCWDATGRFLYLGVTAQRRRGGSAWAVLAFRREGSALHFARVIDIPADGASRIQIPALLIHPTFDALYFHQIPADVLTWYLIEQGRFSPQVTLKLASPEVVLPTPGWGQPFELNRTAELALLATGSPGRGTTGQTDLYVFDLSSNSLGQANQIQLDYPIFACSRLPLTDRFMVTIPTRQSIATLTLDQHQLIQEQVIKTDSFAPQALAFDQWGDLIFVSGKFSVAQP